MSKSKGNYVGITDPPQDMFGKLMSISDVMMWRYFELLSFRPMSEILALKAECESGRNPREAKVMLAQEIVARFHSPAAAEVGAHGIRRALPAGCGAGRHCRGHAATPHGAGMPIAQLAKQAGVVESTSEAFRLIAQNGLRVDAEVVSDKGLVIPAGKTVVVQAGKRKFARVTVR